MASFLMHFEIKSYYWKSTVKSQFEKRTNLALNGYNFEIVDVNEALSNPIVVQ